MDVSSQAREVDRRADDSPAFGWAIRVGLVSYGVVHLMIAWLALRLAFGDGGGSASSQGALHQLAAHPIGQVSLYLVAAGFGAMVVWQLVEAAGGHRDEEGRKRTFKRAVSVGKVVLYGGLALTAAKVATGAGAGNGDTDGMTSKVMSLPGGPVLVALVGVAILVTAGVQGYRGWNEKFRSKLELEGKTGNDGTVYLAFGRFGYVSKALALAVVGLLFCYAAATRDPQKSGGLDQALHRVLEQPFGAPVLVVVALGIGSYGLFCFAWARHLDR